MKFSFRFLTIALAALPSFSLASPLTFQQFSTPPKLVVVVVIDQFRADYLTRFRGRFLKPGKNAEPGGFRYLLDKGAYFPFAEYDVLQNMTCPGHAMILTGARPTSTKIPLNDFMDQDLGHIVPCTLDSSVQTVGLATNSQDVLEGASPKRLATSTVGDELKTAGYGSRVITISLKARSAIMLGGHRADLALLMNSRDLSWISSSFYLPDGKLPTWVEKINGANKKYLDGAPYIWKADSLETGLTLGTPEKNFSRTVDYRAKNALDTPVGLELTTDAALAAIRELKLGTKSAPDLLAISYSAHDGMGHTWGPNSREMEEMTVAEDRSLAKLFAGINKAVPGGIRNALIVLTADHGMAPTVQFSAKARMEAVEIDEKEMLTTANAALQKKFGSSTKGEWLSGVASLNFSINRPAALEKKITLAEIETETKRVLSQTPGIDTVVTGSEVASLALAPGFHSKQVSFCYVPGISGDVITIPKVFSYAGDHPTHMTDYSYDRTVPLIFAGNRVKTGVYATPAKVLDLAPTLSFLLGILPPAKSEGRVLSEAL